MKVMVAADFTRDAARVLEQVEKDNEEVVIMRDETPVARLVPGGRAMTLREVYHRFHGRLTDEEGEAWLRDMEGFDRPLSEELRDPWE